MSLLNLAAILGAALALWMRQAAALKAAEAAKILAQANALKAAKTAEKVDQIKQDVAANTALTEETSVKVEEVHRATSSIADRLDGGGKGC